ncbi:Uncharacterised protein [uncultured archaeon]|nr:Uncharacterised protein [uncultured archaeon]
MGLSNPNTDRTETINLTSYITSSDFNNLIVRFQAHDGNGNLHTAHDLVKIVIDYTLDYPTVSNVITTPQYPKNASEVNICADVTDNLPITINQVVLTCSSFYHASTDYYMTKNGNNYCSGITWSNSRDGENTSCTINATNSQGNSKIQNVPSFTYDGSAPVTTSSGTDTNWHSSDRTITLTPTDPISGVANTYYCIDTTNNCIPSTSGTSVVVNTEGINYVRYYSVDKAGNVETIKQAANTVKIDKTAPIISDNYLFNEIWVNSDKTVTLTPSDSVSAINVVKYCMGSSCTPTTGTTISTPYQLLYSTEQDTIVRYQAWDLAGNPSAIGQYNVKLDKTGPTTSESGASSSWTNSDVTVTLSCNGEISGCNKTYYKINDGSFAEYSSPITLSSTGQYQLVYYSTDNAGNQESPVTGTLVKIDKENPVTTDDYTKDNVWMNSDQTITLTANDFGGSGLLETKYCLTFGCNPETDGVLYTIPVKLTQGISYFRYASKDVAGNVETTNEKIVKIDETTPVTTDNIPSGWQKVPFTITLTENTADGLSPMTTYYKIWNVEGIEPTSWTQGNSVLVNSDGQYNVKYHTTDSAGNIETEKIAENTAKLDGARPSVSISGVPTEWTNIAASLNVVCSDSLSGCDASSYVIKTVSKETDCSSVDYTGGNNPLSASSHVYVCAKASDNAGNSAYSNTTEILVDMITPTLEIIAPTESQSTDKMDYFLVKATADDLGDSKLKDVKLTLTNSNGTIILQNMQMNSGIGDYEYLMRMWNLEAGNYVITIIATDNAGNMISKTRGFSIQENVAPTLISGISTNVPAQTGGTVSFMFNVTVRGEGKIKFGMDDIAGLSPSAFNARISNGTTTVPVGDSSFNGAGILTLTDLNSAAANIQGSFVFYLDIPADMIPGNYPINYYIDNADAV